MPTEEDLTYEITLARNDLEQNLADLKDTVADGLDVAKQAHRVAEVVKDKARTWAAAKRRQIETYVRANPERAVAIGVGSVAALVGIVWLARRLSD